MKNVILALIVGVLVLDFAVVIGPRDYMSVMAAWGIGPSECSLGELLREVHSAEAASSVATPTLERTEDGLDLWKTPQEETWTVHGDTILRFLMHEQLRDIYELPGHEIRKGDVVLDVGANIGMFTRTALARGASLVVAIEPAPRTLNAFRRNLEKEIREGRVVVYPKGAWDHDGEMELSVNEVNQANNTLVLPRTTSMPTIRVPLTTIDKIVAELKLPRVDFIKMDIEGAEKPAIKGAENTIKRFRPRMSLSTEHLADDFAAIPALVHSIEPNYTQRGCDCEAGQKRLKALVMAFDPVL
jgi:FkbM family methyltransferase